MSFRTQDLEQANVADDPTYLQLLPDMPPRIQELAEQITSGYSSPYAKAKALEAYLKTEYPYRFADSPDDFPPPGRDPVDWFLFDHREGTCGVYSSAFVVMALSVGIPARVVSGWAISRTEGTQTVRANQAHQWAEVALEGIGWVSFEPTAPGGAPSRAQDDLDSEAVADVLEALDEGDPEAIADALEELAEGGSGELEDALEALEEAGVDVVRLENGGTIISEDENSFSNPGTTTEQAFKPPHIPVFIVSGADGTPYLREATGDVYEEGGWRQLDPIRIEERPQERVPEALQREYTNGAFSTLPPERRSDPAFFGIRDSDTQESEVLIRVQSANPDRPIPAGVIPVSPDLQDFRQDEVYYPYSGTLRTPHRKSDYWYLTKVQHFTIGQLRRADAASDPTYLQLPPESAGPRPAIGRAGHSRPHHALREGAGAGSLPQNNLPIPLRRRPGGQALPPAATRSTGSSSTIRRAHAECSAAPSQSWPVPPASPPG